MDFGLKLKHDIPMSSQFLKERLPEKMATTPNPTARISYYCHLHNVLKLTCIYLN